MAVAAAVGMGDVRLTRAAALTLTCGSGRGTGGGRGMAAARGCAPGGEALSEGLSRRQAVGVLCGTPGTSRTKGRGAVEHPDSQPRKGGVLCGTLEV